MSLSNISGYSTGSCYSSHSFKKHKNNSNRNDSPVTVSSDGHTDKEASRASSPIYSSNSSSNDKGSYLSLTAENLNLNVRTNANRYDVLKSDSSSDNATEFEFQDLREKIKEIDSLCEDINKFLYYQSNDSVDDKLNLLIVLENTVRSLEEKSFGEEQLKRDNINLPDFKDQLLKKIKDYSEKLFELKLDTVTESVNLRTLDAAIQTVSAIYPLQKVALAELKEDMIKFDEFLEEKDRFITDETLVDTRVKILKDKQFSEFVIRAFDQYKKSYDSSVKDKIVQLLEMDLLHFFDSYDKTYRLSGFDVLKDNSSEADLVLTDKLSEADYLVKGADIIVGQEILRPKLNKFMTRIQSLFPNYRYKLTFEDPQTRSNYLLDHSSSVQDALDLNYTDYKKSQRPYVQACFYKPKSDLLADRLNEITKTN